MTEREKLPDWVQELIAEHNDKGKPLDPNNAAEMYEACLSWWDAYIEIADEQDRKTFALSDELKQFIAYTEALATAAEINGIDSTPLVEFLQDMEGFYFNLSKRLPTAGKPVHVLLDRLKYKLDAAPKTPAVAPPPPPAVELFGQGKPPKVKGNVLPKLTTAQFNVIQALLNAGEKGLTKDELEDRSGHSDARGILRRLLDKEPDWAEVIQMAGKTGGRYRISQ